jgi:hypothetical protein
VQAFPTAGSRARIATRFTELVALQSYSSLTDSHTDGHHVEVSEKQLRLLLTVLLHHVEVDEDWYRSANDDVDRAIAAGKFKSAKEHYVVAGYYEDRMPRPIRVDENWYLDAYPDVAQAIRAGAWRSAQEHFTAVGFREGRLPRPNWSLLSNSAILSLAA